jgi:hypothetical protein
VFEADVRSLFLGSESDFADPKGKWNQRGAGRHSLCEQCNNDTGGWHGAAYVEWAHQGVYLLKAHVGGRQLGESSFTIYPLRVFKQLLVMFCSACGPGLRERLPGIERFLLNREALDAPVGMCVYAYYIDPIQSRASRQSGISGVINVETGRAHIFSEIAFLPFGLILDVGDEPIDPEIADISHFGRGYAYSDKAHIRAALPIRPVNSPLPADFREHGAIRKLLAASDGKNR